MALNTRTSLLRPRGQALCSLRLPPELIDLVIDELQHDIVSLRSCSLVCKSWLPRSSTHLFSSLYISSLPVSAILVTFRNFIPSSTRISLHVRHFEVNVVPHSSADVTALPEHMPNLEITSETGAALLDVGNLANPGTLQSIKLDLSGTYFNKVSAERISKFLQTAGQHIRHFEYAQSLGGWHAPPNCISALATCMNIESIVVTTPKAVPFSMSGWLETLVLFSSLPRHARRAKLVTSCRGLSDHDKALRDFMRELDWHAVGRALGHCRALEGLEIAALDYSHRPIPFAGNAHAQKAVLERLPAWLSSIASFV